MARKRTFFTKIKKLKEQRESPTYG